VRKQFIIPECFVRRIRDDNGSDVGREVTEERTKHHAAAVEAGEEY
jgi:hypothetical protein